MCQCYDRVLPLAVCEWEEWRFAATSDVLKLRHVFAVVKRLWGFDKVRYRGLSKNATRSFVALGLANIYLARGVLYEQVRP